MNAQTPASALNDPEHWRQRSEEARRMADLMGDVLQAVIAHAEDLLYCPQPRPTKSKNRAWGLIPHAPEASTIKVMAQWSNYAPRRTCVGRFSQSALSRGSRH